MKRIDKSQLSRGQTMMEYIILVALLAVASIPVVKVLGNVFRANILESADAIMGDTEFNKKSEIGDAVQNTKVKRSMSDFANEN